MEKNGQLKDDQKYFGINAPGGSRWYNFAPGGYLSCAMSGWQIVDVVDEEYLFPEFITWEDFETFMSLGQIYE